MIVVADSFQGGDIEILLPDGFDRKNLNNLIIIEIELSDIGGSDPRPNPALGIGHAQNYTAQGDLVLLVGAKEYPEIEGWGALLAIDNLVFCKLPLTQELILVVLEKLQLG